jgi:hypothetical protein
MLNYRNKINYTYIYIFNCITVDRKIEEYIKLQTANNKTFEEQGKKQTIENNLLLLKCFFRLL